MVKKDYDQQWRIFVSLIDLSSILDDAFIEEANKRDTLISSSLPIQMKTQLLPVSKPRLNISTNFFDMVG